MNLLPDDMTTNPMDLTLELRFSNGSTTEFYEADEERVREVLRFLAAPPLFAQPHLLLASQHGATMIACKGIEIILAHTSAPLPLKFPLNLPAGLFDIVEQPDAWLDNKPAAIGDQDGVHRQRDLQVEILTFGRWTVTLEALVMFHGIYQDERQFFSQLPNMPTIPFRLEKGGFGLINTVNIMRVSAWPRPETLPGNALPLTLRR